MSAAGAWLVVVAIIAVVVAGGVLAWALLRRSSDADAPAPVDLDEPAPRSSSAAMAASVDVPLDMVPIESSVVPAASVPAAAPTRVQVAIRVPASPPVRVEPMRAGVPLLVSSTPIASPTAPRPPPVAIERVLALEPAELDEWNAAQPLSLLPAQAAAASAAVAVRSGASPLQRVVLEAGTATGIARGDQGLMRSMGAAHGAAPRKNTTTTWLDSSAATALVAAALAALASDRFLAGLGDEVRELKAAVAALPPQAATQGAPILKTLVQDLARFTREARENYASAIARLAFRERVVEVEARAIELWRDVVAQVDATRQQMHALASSPRFGEAQVEQGLSLYGDLHEQRTIQEIAGRVLAAARLLRIAIGDAPSGSGADAIDSALAALRSGHAQDAALATRLAASERAARSDLYVGKAQFDANRVAMRKAMERGAAAPAPPAATPLQAARSALPLDAPGGRPRSLLVGPGKPAGTVELRWLER